VIEVVETAWRACRERRQDVDVPLEAFRAYLAARVPSDADFGAYCIDDLYLACACVAGDPVAVAAFLRDVLPVVDAALASWNPGIVDETRQRLRTSLLVDHAERGPLLASYTGRGALRRWLRVVAVREAARQWGEQARGAGASDDALFDAVAPATDPVMSAIKHDAATAFRAAFSAALGALSRRDRALLRLHVLDGLSVDEIAPTYGVHRATVARWIAAAKQDVLATTRRNLMHDLRLHPDEVDSLIRLVHSRIELPEGALASEPASGSTGKP
jgi:RNA polymerase sigma-70 factor (ECF subfamily)